jgi:hypothetical protein
VDLVEDDERRVEALLEGGVGRQDSVDRLTRSLEVVASDLAHRIEGQAPGQPPGGIETPRASGRNLRESPTVLESMMRAISAGKPRLALLAILTRP